MEKKIIMLQKLREKRMQNDRNCGEQCRGGVHPFFSHADELSCRDISEEKPYCWRLTGRGTLEKLEHVCTGQVGQKNPFRVLDADYYKHVGPEDCEGGAAERI